jgi:hypothetical protein
MDAPASAASPETGAAEEPATVERDKRCFSSSVLIGLGFAALAMLYSLYLFSDFYHKRFLGHSVWMAPADIWNVVDAGRFVWHGALGNVYEAANTYALPLSFILTAPVSALVDHYRLAEGIFPLAHPSAWLVVGPYSLLFGIFLVDAVRRLAWDVGQRRFLWLSQLLAVVIVLVPAFEWGHFEDVIALTFVLHSGRYLLAKDHVRAGLLLSLAVSSKQWAVFLVPLAVFMAPPGRRLKTLAASCALPLLLMLIVLTVGGRNSFDALFSPINMGRNAPGHIAFYVTWLGSKTSELSRNLGLIAAVVLAWKLRRAATKPEILAAISVLLVLRPLSEAINYSYYWSPSLIVAGLVGVAAHRRIRIRDWIWQLVAIAWTLPHGNPATSSSWWAGMVLLLTCTGVQVAWNCGISFRSLSLRRGGRYSRTAPAMTETSSSSAIKTTDQVHNHPAATSAQR